MQRFSPTKLVATYSSILSIDFITICAEEFPESAFDLIVALSHESNDISDPANNACMHNKIKVIKGRVNILIFKPLYKNLGNSITFNF